MQEDRPLPVKTIFEGKQYATLLDSYNYFSVDSLTGLSHNSTTSSGFARWFNVFDTSPGGVPVVSGCLTFANMVVKNDGGSNKLFGARIKMDGLNIINISNLTVVAGTQTGITLAGRIFWRSNKKPVGLALDEFFFDERCFMQVYVDDPSISVFAHYSYYLT